MKCYVVLQQFEIGGAGGEDFGTAKHAVNGNVPLITMLLNLPRTGGRSQNLVSYPDSRVIHPHPTTAITLASGAF